MDDVFPIAINFITLSLFENSPFITNSSLNNSSELFSGTNNLT